MIAIIDYKAGNAPSVYHTIKKLGHEAVFAHGAQDIKNADHIILPGVGSAKATMDSLRDMKIIDALENAVLHRKAYFLGICVGMQILFEYSEEENTVCLGWLKGRVLKFDNAKVRVPQMGWNKVWNDYFYFVNSYYTVPEDKSDVWGTADYNGSFAAAVRRNNISGTQFHTEKSGVAGLNLLDGWLKNAY